MAEIVTAQFANPMDSFGKAYQVGFGIRQMQAQAEAQAAAAKEAEAKRAAEEQRQAQIAAAYDKLRSGEATPEDYINLSTLIPKEQADSIRETFKMLEEDKQKTALNETGQIFSALKAGRPEIAVQLLDDQVRAAENAGMKEQAQFLKTWRDVAKENPEAAEDFFGFTLGQIPGGDKVIENALKLSQERRTEAREPLELDKLSSDASKAATDAVNAPEDARLAQEKTRQEIEESKARVNRIAVELKEREKAGGLTPKEVADSENELRKELQTQTKDYRLIMDSYARTRDAFKTGAGDLAIVFNFMKTLDPSSSVREGEQASAAGAAGVPAKILAGYNELVGKGKLSDKSRLEMLGEMKRINDAAALQAKQAQANIFDIAKRRGLNTKNIDPEIIVDGSL